jgi:glycosyltransferase involved in cell wall biosynthesis
MRILALTSLYPNPYEPTLATFNRQQLRALAALHPVRVIAPIPWVRELSGRLRGGERLPAGRRRTVDGLVVEHPRFFYPPGILRGWHGPCYLGSVRAAFRRALGEWRPDLVFATWAHPDGWAGVRLGHEAGLPVVVKVHGSDVLWRLSRRSAKGRQTADALRAADAVVTVSRDLAEHVVRLGAEPDRVRVVHNGVDSTAFHPRGRAEARARLAPGPAPVLLCVARLVPVKGLEVLVEAGARLARGGARFRCFIIGDGPLRPRLQEQINGAGLGESITLLGSMPHDRLPDWFRAADVFVLPSYSEGLPCVLLEALACGTPFVATRVGGTPELASLGEGRLVAAGDPAGMAAAITEVLARPPGGDSRTTALRSHAAAAADLEGLFREILQRSRSSAPRLCSA